MHINGLLKYIFENVPSQKGGARKSLSQWSQKIVNNIVARHLLFWRLDWPLTDHLTLQFKQKSTCGILK